jgi:hypothetical protein
VKLALGLLFGWVIGAKVLDADYSDVAEALRAVARSDELRDVVQTVRAHASQTLRDVAGLLEPAPVDEGVAPVTDLGSRRSR